MKRKDFKDYYNGRRGCYLLTSSHQLAHLIFKAREDYVFGVNTLAILLPGSGVTVLAYCLMGNHIHLLLAGTLDDCLDYYDKVILRISHYLRRVHGITGILRQEDLDIASVIDDQQLKNYICYLHRNPYKARIASPFSYPWSSADCFFPLYCIHGETVSGLNCRERFRVFNTRKSVPDEYEYIDGKILNASFVSYDAAIRKFKDSVEYFDLLRKYSLEAEVEETLGIHESITYSDSELIERITAVCKREFNVESCLLLNRKDLMRLARIMAKRYGAGQKQISRLLGIDKSILDRFL